MNAEAWRDVADAMWKNALHPKYLRSPTGKRTALQRLAWRVRALALTMYRAKRKL